MKITYLRLENVAGLNVARSRPVVEIDLSRGQNRIVLIRAANGQGKSTLLSALQPFATVTALDERSSIPFIIRGKSGYKEIRYRHGDETYTIKHYYKPNGHAHTVKSYFSIDGKELNENGNVTSFLALVETYFGLTPEMIRLLRLGSNVSSFVSLKPAERKNYIGRLIDEIEVYLHLHRKISDELRVTKLMMSTNVANLRDCRVDDPDGEADRCLAMAAEINEVSERITELKVRSGELDRLVAKHDISELRRQRDEARGQLAGFERTEKEVAEAGLTGVKLTDLSRKLTELMDQRLEMVTGINAIKLSIDGDRRRIEQLRANIARITSESDVNSLVATLGELERSIAETDPTIKAFESNGWRSDDLGYYISRLNSLNQISQLLLSLGSKPVALYLSLIRDGRSVGTYLKEQAERRTNRLGEADVRRLIDEVFQGELIISPNCDDAFLSCPYYRFSRVLTELRNQASDDLQDDDVLRYLRLVATNVDTVTTEAEKLGTCQVPEGFKLRLSPEAFLNRLSAKQSFFRTDDLQDHLTVLKGNEIYRGQLAMKERLTSELRLYRSSGADRLLAEIEDLEKTIADKQRRIAEGTERLTEHERQIAKVEHQVALVTSYAEANRYRDVATSSLTSAEKLLGPLETASEQRSELQHQLFRAETELMELTERHRAAEQRLDNYHRLIDEGKRLTAAFNKQSVLQTAVSTKKGIPLIYVKVYQSKIRKLTNDLLRIVYDGRLEVMDFNITETDFEIPVRINGKLISDIRFTSQSEVDLITLALSFAISYETNRVYNIPLLDEIDGGLDDTNRTAFVRMLDGQLKVITGEQCFIISHNLSQIANLPMDVIWLVGDDDQISEPDDMKLQRVIYEG